MWRPWFCFVVFVFLFSFVLCDCPNGCSGDNGVCLTSNVCECKEGWTGDDCSISDVVLHNHVSVDGHVSTRRWKYFHILASSQQASVEFEINQTSVGGDIDVYVRFDKYPTRQLYDMRDISTSKSMKFVVRSPHGIYYLGVYGFLASDFSVMATIKTSCLNDCSGHGTCTFNGNCQCNDGYVGEDCSESSIALSNNVSVSSVVGLKKWQYFSFENKVNNTIVLYLTHNESVDCDLYITFQSFPTASTFDFRDSSNQPNTRLYISGAFLGKYYIGVYGYSTDNTTDMPFTLRAESFSECPNRCSGASHGNCTDTYTCHCKDDFVGETCETMISSVSLDGQNHSGYVFGNNWNYYHFDTYTSTNVVVEVLQNNTNEDCDLYVRRGQNPTALEFDYRDVTSGDSEVTVQNPGLATWYVGVYGYTECTYLLNVEMTRHCPNNCTDEEHGVCEKGHCRCHDDWIGRDCSVKSTFLTNGEVVKGSVKSGGWIFYRFDAVPETKVTAVLSELGSKGVLRLYESLEGAPTLSGYDFSDTEPNTAIHRIRSVVSQHTNMTVGVFGSVIGSPNVEYQYQLVMWQSRFDDE